MSEYFDYIKENWRIVSIGLLVVGFFFYDKLVALVKGINLSKFRLSSKKNNKQDVEMEDIRCINHLRDRAVVSGDATLLQEIKSISQKFFDIHTATKNE